MQDVRVEALQLNRPLRLLPRFYERPWGVPSLAPWFAHQVGACIGEAWLTDGQSGSSLGLPLGDLLARHADDLLGSPAVAWHQPLLLKWIFTADRLSVQVHPDDEYAQRHHGSPGKTEAWHVVAASHGASVALGFSRTLDVAEARDAARTGSIERLLSWHPARAGDTFLVPAGTVHALGAGLTLVEVQEPSDITYRLFDYGRPRELHLDHGFNVARLSPYDTSNAPTPLRPGRTWLTSCAYFTMERLAVGEREPFSAAEPFYHLLTVLGGRGQVAGQPAGPGDTFFVPAVTRPFVIEGTLEVLLACPSPAPTRALA